MIFGGEAASTEVGTELIRVRHLELDEVHRLGPDELIYVQDSDFSSQVLVPAYRKMGTGNTYLEGEKPRLHVHSIYGSEFWVSAEEGVFERDDLGEEVPVVRSAGSRVSSSIFITGVSASEAEERIRKALRDEFGPGVVEVWNMRSGPVRDLRWDVWEVKTAWVPREGTRKGKGQQGNYKEVDRRLIARGVRDGHQHHFTGKESPGWNLIVGPHQPNMSQTEVL